MLRRDPAVCENELELQISERYKKVPPLPTSKSFVCSCFTLNFELFNAKVKTDLYNLIQKKNKHKITAELKDTDSDTDQCCKTWKNSKGGEYFVLALYISVSVSSLVTAEK